MVNTNIYHYRLTFKWKEGLNDDNLWKTMKKRGVTQYSLIKDYHISPAQITRLKRNESVSTHTIEMFCEILDCNVEDIMQYKKTNSCRLLCTDFITLFS